MRIGAGRRCAYVAAGVLAIAAGSDQRLVAQSSEKANRSVELAPTVSLGPSRLEPARGILRNLVGTWRFEIWFAGNFNGAPDASGTRVVTTLFDDLRLEWTEELDHSQIRGQGIIGFDPRSGRFFSASVYNTGPAPEFMTGILDNAEPLVTFSPIAISGGAGPGQKLVQSSTLTMLDHNHFRWTGLDRGWRAVFTRQP